jgi:hypothetical protein
VALSGVPPKPRSRHSATLLPTLLPTLLLPYSGDEGGLDGDGSSGGEAPVETPKVAEGGSDYTAGQFGSDYTAGTFVRMLIFGGADEGDESNGTYEVPSDIHVLRIPFATLEAIVDQTAATWGADPRADPRADPSLPASKSLPTDGEEQDGEIFDGESVGVAGTSSGVGGTFGSTAGGNAADAICVDERRRMRWERPRTWLVDVAGLHTPVVLQPPQLHLHMERLLQSGEFSDVSLSIERRLGDEEQTRQAEQQGQQEQDGLAACKVHKLILALRSPRLHALLTNGMAESSQPVVRIDEDAGDFLALIRYVYTGTLAGLEAERLTGLLVLARAYLMEDLVMLCQGGLLHLLSLDATNAVSGTVSAHTCKTALPCIHTTGSPWLDPPPPSRPL